MIQDKTQSVKGSLSKDGEASAPAHAPDLRPVGQAVLDHLGRSLRASRDAAVQRCRLRAPTFGAPLGKDAPLPARRALRSTTSRLAEHINITTKEYY
jgi:hypothetical protein